MTKIIIGRSSDHKLALALSERLHRRTKFAPTFRVSALRLSGSGRLELNTKPFRAYPPDRARSDMRYSKPHGQSNTIRW